MLEMIDMSASRETSRLPAHTAALSRHASRRWTGMATLAGICLYLITCVAIGAVSHSTHAVPGEVQAARVR